MRSIGVDVRRFASFGVIKVKSYPSPSHARPHLTSKLVRVSSAAYTAGRSSSPTTHNTNNPPTAAAKPTTLPPSPIGLRKRASSLTVPPLASSASTMRANKRRTSDAMLAFATVSTHSTSGTVSLPPRAAEASLGTLRSRTSGGAAAPSSPQTVRVRYAAAATTPASLFEITQSLAPPPPTRPDSHSPSSPAIKTQSNGDSVAPAPILASLPMAYPAALVPLLDGEHHADELCYQFEVGWPTLERWLVAVGGGSGDGDFGKVLIIYR